MKEKKLNNFDFNDPKYIFKRKNEQGEWVTASSEEVKGITLEDGNYIPDLHYGHTQINHYISTFWSHILGPTPFMIYFQLVKFCYGRTKNHAWPDEETLAMYCGISRRTFDRNIIPLIEHKLVEVVQVYVRQKGEGAKQTTNLYFVRRSTPFISVELYEKLPPILREEHDEFIESLRKSGFVAVHMIPNYTQDDPQDIHTTHKGEAQSVKMTEREISQLDKMTDWEARAVKMTERENCQLDNLTERQSSWSDCPGALVNLTRGDGQSDRQIIQDNNTNFNKRTMMIWDQLLSLFKDRMTKQAYETWMKPLQLISIADGIAHFQSNNAFQKQWVQQRYTKLILDAFHEIGENVNAIWIH
jgi:hypothetical protein